LVFAYAGPGTDTRTVPARISDNIAADVNLLPSATFTVSGARCPSPVPPKSATNITTQWPVCAPWNDEYIFTSELFLSNGSDFAGASGIKGAVSQNSNLFCRSNGTAGSFRLYWTPPTGWQ